MSQKEVDITCDSKGGSIERYMRLTVWKRMTGKAQEEKLFSLPKTF